MTIAITALPRIIDTLGVDGTPQFVIVRYDEFVRLVVVASAGQAPDIVSILDHAGEHLFVILPFKYYSMYINMLEISGEIDEEHYLNKHTDVKIAVEQGKLRSGTHHYVRQGYFERREVRFPATGRGRIAGGDPRHSSQQD